PLSNCWSLSLLTSDRVQLRLYVGHPTRGPPSVRRSPSHPDRSRQGRAGPQTGVPAMLHVQVPRRDRTCDGSSRRDFLKIGALGIGGLPLPDPLRARAAQTQTGKASRNTSVVWLWLGGGPTHIETFDPKMTAPAEFRSVVGAVKTNVTGVEYGGVFPKMAKQADKLAVVRSF